MLESVDTVSILAEGEYDIDKKIHIEIDKKKMKCKGIKDIGEIEVELSMEFDKKIQFAVNPIFLKDILNKSRKVKIGNDRILFDTGNFKHLIGLFIE